MANGFSLTLRVRKKASSRHSSDPLKAERAIAIKRSFKSHPDRSTGPLRSCWVPKGWSQAEHFGRISRVLFIAGHDGCIPNDDFGPDRSFPMKMRFAGIGGIRLARATANSSPTLDVRGAQRRMRGLSGSSRRSSDQIQT